MNKMNTMNTLLIFRAVFFLPLENKDEVGRGISYELLLILPNIVIFL